MGADIKQIKNRIKSVDSTLHITKAMKLVASSKIHRAELKRRSSLPFSSTLGDMITDMLSPDTKKSPFVTPINPSAPTLYILIESDRGLAGSFNGNVNREFSRVVKENDAVIPIGKRACDFINKQNVKTVYSIPSSEHITDDEINGVASLIVSGMENGEYSGVRVISNVFKNAITQETELKTVLPLETVKKKASLVKYEPDVATVFSYAVPMYVSAAVRSAVYDSFYAEQYARRNAMDSASENASEMIDKLSLQYNRARQNTITQEITEIVAGAGSGN